MGAAFNMREMRCDGVEELRKRFAEMQEDDRYENGHSYSGGLGMARGLKVLNKTFASCDEAEDWLCDHAEKWGPALAVRVERKPGGPTDEKLRDVWVVGAWCSS